MRTAALRKVLEGIGFVELAEREGHVLLRSAKSQVVLPVREPLKPTTLQRFEGFSIRVREVAPPRDYPSEPRYAVRLEPIEDEWWLATVPSRPGCLTQGKTVSKAVARIRDALTLFDEAAHDAELEVMIDLPAVKRGREEIDAARALIDAARARVDGAVSEVEARRRGVDDALARLEAARAEVAAAEAEVEARRAGVGDAEDALDARTADVIARLVDDGFDVADAALLLGMPTRDARRLLKRRPPSTRPEAGDQSASDTSGASIASPPPAT